MFCPNCGAQVSDGAGFCPKCGGALGPRAAAPVTPAAAVAAAPRGPLARPAARAAAIVAAAVAALAVAFLLAKAFLPGLLGLTFVNEAAFPDEGFRAFVSEKADLDGNGILTPEEKGAVQVIDLSTGGSGDGSSSAAVPSGTVSLYEEKMWAVEGLSDQPVSLEGSTSLQNDNRELVSSLEGLKRFEDLRVLDCSGLGLSELDLSGNPNLEYVSCLGNEIQSLDLSKNAGLTTLYCDTDVSLEGLGDANLYFTELPVTLQESWSDGDNTNHVMTYDALGCLRERFCDGELQYEYAYDEQGRSSGRVSYGTDGEQSSAREYRYDDSGRLASFEDSSPNGTSFLCEYKYDSAGYLTEEACIDAYSIFAVARRISVAYGYDSAGRISFSSHVMEDGNSSETQCSYAYDDSGCLDSLSKYDSRGNETTVVKMLRDESGTLYGRASGSPDGDDGERFETEYDENGFPVKTTWFYGDSSVSYETAFYDVDSEGYIVSVTYEYPSEDAYYSYVDGLAYNVEYAKRVGSLEDRASLRYVPTVSFECWDPYDADMQVDFFNGDGLLDRAPVALFFQEPVLQPRDELGLVDYVLLNSNERMLQAYDKELLSS